MFTTKQLRIVERIRDSLVIGNIVSIESVLALILSPTKMWFSSCCDPSGNPVYDRWIGRLAG
jgi:hypothetical protein